MFTEALTEEEARAKRCHRGGQIGCMASECMAWRWADRPFVYCTMDNRAPDPKRPGWLTTTGGNPPAPAGEGWEPECEPRQKDGYVAGVLEQVWRRRRKDMRGHCACVFPADRQFLYRY